jgi:hypothetical protein
MDFSFEMTIKELVKEMNNGGTQKDLYKLSKIPKDILPYLFKAAGYTHKKQKYIPEANANENITIEYLLPTAREVHMQTKIAKLTNEPAPKVVLLEAKEPTKIEKKQELIETNVRANVVDFSDKPQMQHAILEVLNLTPEDLEAIRSIRQIGEPTTDKVSIFEEIKKLSGRNRANKTYFMSKELSENIKEFADNNNIKVSQIIEIAIIDFLKKY